MTLQIRDLLPGAQSMLRITKKPTQDGTFTVYVEEKAIAWGLTTSAADRLIERLQRTPGSVRAIL
jgi:hypothetical protein